MYWFWLCYIKKYGEIRSRRKFNIFRLEIGTYIVFFYCMTCFCGKCPSWRIFLLFLFWMINKNVVFFYNRSNRLIKPHLVQGWHCQLDRCSLEVGLAKDAGKGGRQVGHRVLPLNILKFDCHQWNCNWRNQLAKLRRCSKYELF